MTIVKTSSKRYRKVTEVLNYQPTKEEAFYWYSGTSAGIDPDNPYALPNQYMTRTRYEEVENDVNNATKNSSKS